SATTSSRSCAGRCSADEGRNSGKGRAGGTVGRSEDRKLGFGGKGREVRRVYGRRLEARRASAQDEYRLIQPRGDGEAHHVPGRQSPGGSRFWPALGGLRAARKQDLRRNGRADAETYAAGMARQQSAGACRAAGARGDRARRTGRLISIDYRLTAASSSA